MNLRRLNSEGLRLFGEYLDALKVDPALQPPLDLLTHSVTSEEAAGVDVAPQHFGSRLAAGRWLHALLEDAKIADAARDKGLWAWLSLFFFDEVCPPDGRGHRKPGKRYRHISDSGDYRVYYRHLLNGPWRVFRLYRDNPDDALALLCQRLDKPGDVVEQICGYQELVTNRSVVRMATILYVDPVTKTAKHGTQTKKAGGPRRIYDFANQHDVTWDLYFMSADELLGKLPKEFRRFQPKV